MAGKRSALGLELALASGVYVMGVYSLGIGMGIGVGVRGMGVCSIGNGTGVEVDGIANYQLGGWRGSWDRHWHRIV